jgi:hypothetical protein
VIEGASKESGDTSIAGVLVRIEIGSTVDIRVGDSVTGISVPKTIVGTNEGVAVSRISDVAVGISCAKAVELNEKAKPKTEIKIRTI